MRHTASVFIPKVTSEMIDEAVKAYPFLGGLKIRPILTTAAAAQKAFNDYNEHAEITSEPEAKEIISVTYNEEMSSFIVELDVPDE